MAQIMSPAGQADYPFMSESCKCLDLHVKDPRSAHDEAVSLGARLLHAAPSFDAHEGHQVYAEPAGHPFCIGWGH
jgi:hypothetical protein